MLSNYVNDINKRIIKLSNEIKEEAAKKIESADSNKEKEKIKYIAMYYNSVLQGVRLFSEDILSSYSPTTSNAVVELEENPVLNINIAEVSKELEIPQPPQPKSAGGVTEGKLKVKVSELSEPFEIDDNALNRIKLSFAKRRERMTQDAMKNRKKSSGINVVELSNNPKLKTEVAEIYNAEDIVLEENPTLKTSVSVIYEDDLIIPESFSDNDIILDENPELKVEVAEIYGADDIVLDKNPDLKTEVAEVYDADDIVLDKNPELKVDVAEVYDADDIVLEENPELKTDVAEVYDEEDIVLDKNPNLKTEVAEVYDADDIVLDKNPSLKINVSKISNDDLDLDLDEKQDVEKENN